MQFTANLSILIFSAGSLLFTKQETNNNNLYTWNKTCSQGTFWKTDKRSKITCRTLTALKALVHAGRMLGVGALLAWFTYSLLLICSALLLHISACERNTNTPHTSQSLSLLNKPTFAIKTLLMKKLCRWKLNVINQTQHNLFIKRLSYCT